MSTIYYFKFMSKDIFPHPCFDTSHGAKQKKKTHVAVTENLL